MATRHHRATVHQDAANSWGVKCTCGWKKDGLASERAAKTLWRTGGHMKTGDTIDTNVTVYRKLGR